MKKKLSLQLVDGDWSLTADEEQVGVWTDQETALTAALELFQEEASADGRRPRFALDFLEGEETVDFRIIDVGAIALDREPPWPLMFTKERTAAHQGSTLVGVIDSGGRVGDQAFHFEGRFDNIDDNEAAAEAVRLLSEGVMATWSPDIGRGKGELECTEMGADDMCKAFVEHLESGVFLGGTMVPFQALDSAKITLLSEDGEGSPVEDEESVAASAVTAARLVDVVSRGVAYTSNIATNAVPYTAASREPTTAWAPSATMFEREESPELHPVVIEGDAVYGYLAAWNVCHTGIRDRCVLAPRSALDYGAFHVGTVVTTEGETLRVGRLTIGVGHAGLSLRENEARSHYDSAGTAWALVRAVDGERGIWVSGVVLPDVDEMTLIRARACALSGDWRQVAGGLELVAALSVPVPGFPLVASGVVPESVAVRAAFDEDNCTALVAAGAWGVEQHRGDPRITALEAEVRELRAWRQEMEPLFDLLTPTAVARLVDEVHLEMSE